MRPLVKALAVTGATASLLASTAVAATATRALPGTNPPADRLAALAFAGSGEPFTTDWPQAARAIERAAERGARYVVLPEMVLASPSSWVGESIPGPTTREFGRHAERLGVWIAFSIAETNPAGEGFFVTTVVLDDRGELIFQHRKVARQLGGDGGAIPGSPRAILETLDVGNARLGVLHGDDLRVGVPRLAARGADAILVSAGWESNQPVDWVALCASLAERYDVRLVVANRVPLADAEGHRAATGVFAAGRRTAGTAVAGGTATAAFAAGPRSRGSWKVERPLGLPTLPVPTDRPLDPAVVALGGELFFDTGLSSTGTVSCATCHRPEAAFANGETAGEGVHGRRTERNVPTLLNVAYRGSLFWDGNVATLEAQAKYPITGAGEMNFHYLDEAVDYVRGESRYGERFQAAMGVEEIEFDHIARALADFQRTLVSADSAFDRYAYGDDPGALNASARRGLELFRGEAGCAQCHAIGEHSALFLDNDHHNTGVGYDAEAGAFKDPGLGLMSQQAGLFLTPSLRDVALTPPYMHDGSLATLEEVVAFYDRGAGANPGLDPKLRPLGLSAQDQRDLVAFLHSLTGESRLPERVESGIAAAGDGPTAAALAFAPEPGQRWQNRRLLAGLIRMAAQSGASVVVLPEYADNGPLERPESALGEARESWSSARDFFAAQARQHRVWLSVPLLEPSNVEADAEDLYADKVYLTNVLFDAEGNQVLAQRKLWPRPTRGEGGLAAGRFEDLRVVHHGSGRIGVLSGDDLAVGAERLAELGAETILVSASWRDADRVDWLERAAQVAQRYAVDLVISNLQRRGDQPDLSGDDLAAASLRSAGAVVETSKAGRNQVFLAAFEPPTDRFDLDVPFGIPAPPQPPHNRLEANKVALGEELFFDSQLSVDGTVSCATCHMPDKAFGNGEKFATGVEDRPGQLNVPSLLNVAYRPFLTWEKKVRTLEDQIRHALQGWPEMASRVEDALEYVRGRESYRRAFREVTGRDQITFDDLARAIASYERTLLQADSAYDRYRAGDSSALSAAAERGLELFAGKASCANCHQLDDPDAMFTDGDAHNTGVGFHPRFEYLGYKGDGLEGNMATGNGFNGEYPTPSLRNVEHTAPYMHDGSLATLEEVIDFYDRGGVDNPFLDDEMKPLHLSAEERSDLLEFLHSLTGQSGSVDWQAAPGAADAATGDLLAREPNDLMEPVKSGR